MIDMTHYVGLYAGYAIGAGGWLLARMAAPRLWPIERASRSHFVRPWREFLWAMTACAGVIFVGQLYQHGLRLPTNHAWSTPAEMINQILIFSPVIVLLIVRRQSSETAWLPTDAIPTRLAIGLVLALLALLAYCAARQEPARFDTYVRHVYAVSHADKAMQVFLEDMTIAVLMCRLTAALKRPWAAAGLVAALFAAGHLPAMIANGVTAPDCLGLVFDALLGLFIVRILQRAADIWWFFCLHVTMDMTQFVPPT